jgi:hypothetical protein
MEIARCVLGRSGREVLYRTTKGVQRQSLPTAPRRAAAADLGFSSEQQGAPHLAVQHPRVEHARFTRWCIWCTAGADHLSVRGLRRRVQAIPESLCRSVAGKTSSNALGYSRDSLMKCSRLYARCRNPRGRRPAVSWPDKIFMATGAARRLEKQGARLSKCAPGRWWAVAGQHRFVLWAATDVVR